MSDHPTVVPPGTPQVDKKYLEVPQDEVPPKSADDPPVRYVEPVLLHIMVNLDQKPLLHAINEAVQENNIQKVINILNGAKIEAEQTGKMRVHAVIKPGK